MAYQSKKHRKFVASAVTAAVVASAVAPAAGFAAEAPKFKDVPTWAKDAVDYLVGKGAINGYEDGTFKPDQSIKRAEAAKILAVTLGLTIDDNAKTDLKDAKDHWASKYIAAIQKHNKDIISGYENGTFKPEATITRQEMAKMVVTAYNLKLDESAILDFTDNNGWGKDYINILASLGVVNGKSAGKFAPNASVTRAETPVFVHRAEVPSVRLEVKTSEAKVVSVSAINAKKLEVKFNKEVSKTAAETAANYTFVGLVDSSNNPVAVSSYELQKDGKTVVIRLASALKNDISIVATVSEIATKADANVKTKKFTTTLNFSDTVKPALASVTYPRAGVAELNFTEELSSKGTVVVYEGSSVSTDVAQSTFTSGDQKLVFTGLKPNKEYKVVVVGALDQSGNLIAAPIEVVIKNTINDTVAPDVKSLTTVGRNTVKVEFTEGLDTIAAGTYANLYLDGSATAVAGTTQSFDEETNTLTITKAGLVAADGIHSVKVDGYKDYAGNTGKAYTKTVTFSNAAPAVKKTEVVKKGTDTFVQVTFDKAPVLASLQTDSNGGGAANGVYTLTYTTPEKIQKTTTIAAADITLDTTDSSAPKALFKVTGKEAGEYKLVLPKANVTDGTTAATADVTITFTLGTATDATKPAIQNVFLPGSDASSVVSGVTSVPLNTVYVKYDKEMSAAALNAANYTVDGVTVFENPVFVGDKTVVKLTIKENAVTISGARNFAISNAVTGTNNVAIDSYAAALNFKENVRPQLVSAKLLGSKSVELTFSEAIKDDSLSKADFTVTVDGSTVALDATSASSWLSSGTADDNVVTLVLASNITVDQFAKAITVKLGKDAVGTDLVGNKLIGEVTINVAK